MSRRGRFARPRDTSAFHANGDSARARASLASLDPNLLTRAEKALVAPLLQGSP
jgi:hypothetical protein